MVALADWQRKLEQLKDLPSRTPPGKLSVANVRRLAEEKHAHRERFLDVEDELGSEAPMLTRGVVSQRLADVTKMAAIVVDFSVMLREALALYGERSGKVAEQAGIPEDWHERDQEDYNAIHKRWEVLARAAMPELGGIPWQEVWANLREGERS